MALIVRIDVDRPYGKQPLIRHIASRLSSDWWLPRISALQYLGELATILQILSQSNARAYAFFRQCTLPSPEIVKLMNEGGHEIGLHLEDSRSFDSFNSERQRLERHIGRRVTAFSKHGSGGAKYGRNHYAPYEPAKYVEWGRQAEMKVFFGNLEDPRIKPHVQNGGLASFPAAFWLEPQWRDTQQYPVKWLLREAETSNIVLLIHPENVLASHELLHQFRTLVSHLETRILA